MNFASEEFVWVGALLALLSAALYGRDVWRRQRVFRAYPGLRQMANGELRGRRVLRLVLGSLGLALLGVALARPTAPGHTVWRERGIDVVVAVDASASMFAEDVYPTRFARSVRESYRLIDELAPDRIASIVFAGGAAHVPLTHDNEAAKRLLGEVRASDVAEGADIGLALRLATCLLRSEFADDELCALFGNAASEGREAVRGQVPEQSDRGRAIVLFTDGEDRYGAVREEAARARALGIAVYVIGVGTRDAEPSAAKGGAPWAPRNDERLEELAVQAEGRYFKLGRTFRIGDVLAELSALSRGDLDARRISRPRDVFDRFAFPALLLLFLEAWLSARRRTGALPGAQS